MPSSNRIAGPLAAYTLTAAFADVPDIAIELAQRPTPILLIAVVKVGNSFAGVRAPSLQLARDGVQVGGSLEPMWLAPPARKLPCSSAKSQTPSSGKPTRSRGSATPTRRKPSASATRSSSASHSHPTRPASRTL